MSAQLKPYDDDLVTWINGELRRSKDHCREWRKKAKESYEFYASEQWTEEDKSSMEARKRVPVVFNRIARTINSVAGLEVQNRQEVRYIPRELNDTGVNDVLTEAAKWVRDNCDAEDEESEAFQDSLICGIGWTDTWMDYESDPDGLVKIDRVDPLDMLWDPNSKKRNLDDSRWIARFKKLPRSEFENMWPDATPQANSVDLEMDKDEPHDATEAKFYRDKMEDNELPATDKLVTVIQFQWWERGPYYQVQGQSGKIVEFSEERFKKLKAQIERLGFKYVKRTKRLYKQAFVNGNEVLEEGEGPCNESFSIRSITGLRDRNDNTWFGIVELMKDPQRWANKWLSQIMHIINSNAKGGLLAEEGAFKNIRKAEEDWSKSDAIVWLNPGGIDKVQEKGQAAYPEGLDRLLQHALQSINDVPGVNLELLGLANRQQAGYLEAQRKQAGVTILAVFFDALRRYRKEQGRVLAYFIKEYISDGRLVRIVEKGQEQYISLLKEQTTYTYDVVVDDGPSSPNMKEKVFAILQQLLPGLQQAGIPIPPDLLDYTPLPESMVKKWKEFIQQQGQRPDPRVQLEQQKLQFEQQKAQADNQLQQSKSQQDMQMKQQEFQFNAQLEAQKAQNEQAQMQAEQDLKRQQAILDAELERQKAANEIQLAREKAMAELNLKRDIAKHDAETKTNIERIKSGGLPDSAANQMTTILADLMKELKDSNAKMHKSTQDMHSKIGQIMGADRVVVRDKKGRVERSKIVLN